MRKYMHFQPRDYNSEASTSQSYYQPKYSAPKPEHRQSNRPFPAQPNQPSLPRSLETSARYASEARLNPPKASSASVIVFAFALSGIILIFLLFYFLSRICSPKADDDIKDVESSRNDSKQTFGKKSTIDSPRHVLYPKRIYEIQAEEGYYSSLPSITQSETSTCNSVVVLKPSGGVDTKKRVQRERSFSLLLRKLTTASAPLNMDQDEQICQINAV
ncbi:unnamed protein product [Bursaphelenchus okinawaensis]|uniref:Uncharacterized protein n=1 Tax=Bursaphelenchus okinawaensis TaxID=465554 RepID=A0A811LD48_9BILA|nr:unnamed protein product [Bursaphelenchus okinawaensis]CAG9121118.1 unnamed protein product [Bursaphelenchus okinawaensis]